MTSFFNNLSRNLVAFFALGIAAGIIVGLFAIELPVGNRDVAMVALGVALGWATSVVHWHFGSSEGSKAKTDILAARVDPSGEQEQ